MSATLYLDTCPTCGRDLHRSRRRGVLDRVITAIFRVQIFRCHGCSARFYVYPSLYFRAPDNDHSHHEDHRVETPSTKAS